MSEPVTYQSVRAAISQQQWTTLRNELMKQTHEVYDDVRSLLEVWNRYLDHPSENAEEVKDKVTASLREILLPETWKLRLKVLQIPSELPTVSSATATQTPSGSRPAGTVISGSASGSASVGAFSPSTGPGLIGLRPPLPPGNNLINLNPDGLSLNGGIRVEAPFLSKLLGILW